MTKSTSSLLNNNLIVEIAKSQIGYEEQPTNKTMYGKWYGLNGQPWCAMFVSWVFDQADESKRVAASNAKGFASCDAGLKWFSKKKIYLPKPAMQ